MLTFLYYVLITILIVKIDYCLTTSKLLPTRISYQHIFSIKKHIFSIVRDIIQLLDDRIVEPLERMTTVDLLKLFPFSTVQIDQRRRRSTVADVHIFHGAIPELEEHQIAQEIQKKKGQMDLAGLASG